jgi:hypothetical protein
MQNQRGIALLVAIVVAVLLSLLGLTLTFTAMKGVSTATEFENHEKALMVADAGLNLMKGYLRGKDLSTLLKQQKAVPQYISASGGTSEWLQRMPIFAIEARNVNFESLPSPVGSRAVAGFLTPVAGQSIAAGSYSGRFFAKLTDNRDEAAFSRADDQGEDLDGIVYLRVVGIHRNLPGETVSYGTSIKNSVAVVEAMLKRDMSFDLQSPLSVYGGNPVTTFSGNSFKLDGYDHRGMSYQQIISHHKENENNPFLGMSCLYDAPGGAQGAVTSVTETLKANQQYDNITGAGPTSPSVGDGTDDIKNSENPDATNIFDPYFLAYLMTMVGGVADFNYADGTKLSGSGILLGTVDDPKITVANGNLDISGGGSGAGIMIVKGGLTVGGAFDYEGVILVLGEGGLNMGGANKSFLGGIYVANVTQSGDTCGFGEPTVRLDGNSNFYMKSDSIQMGYSLLPMRLLSWREITPEIEPGS